MAHRRAEVGTSHVLRATCYVLRATCEEGEMTTRVLMVLALTTNVACGVRADGPPEIDVDRTACSHCGMLISEPVYAAAYRTPGSDPRVFDDIRCLLEAAHQEPRADALRFWFHDAATA